MVPITNGVIRSFGHVRLEIAGLEFTGGFKSIKRKRNRKREVAYSNSPDPIGKTLGENEYEAGATVYFDWWANLLLTVQQNLGPGYGDQPFTVYCSYVGRSLVTYTDTIVNCTFDSTEADDQQGTAALVRAVEFNPTKIYFAGVGGALIDDLEDPLVPGF
jgi:hypothetical protein